MECMHVHEIDAIHDKIIGLYCFLLLQLGWLGRKIHDELDTKDYRSL